MALSVKKIHQPFLLSVCSGLLLFAAWPMSPCTFLIFIAFIPLLVLSELNLPRWKYLLCIYSTMLIWNISTTWWIWFASPPGAVAAFLANSLLMCIPWLIYRRLKRKPGRFLSYLGLIAFWMIFEFLHLQDWGLSWPWLTLGNVFANQTNWIQWYEITGVAGGTLWVLVVNVILFHIFYKKQAVRKSPLLFLSYLIGIASIFAITIFASIFLKPGPEKINRHLSKIAICQPNIDPYTKISSGTFAEQLRNLIQISRTVVDSGTNLLIWPETALFNEYRFDENEINGNHKLDSLFLFLKEFPRLQLFTGIESYRYFDHPTPDSRSFPDTNIFYESYNSSVLLDASGARQYYHKSKLVPGVETLPAFLNILGKWFEKFGGTTNGYVKNNTRTVIQTSNGTSNTNFSLQIAPSICYESIYGAFMSSYMQKGANLIAIITNDGWWQNTPGHKQHMSYARLRAIENRTWVARSANTGISCFIQPDGAVLEPRPYNTKSAIQMTIPIHQRITFYTRFPDLLYKVFYVLGLFILGLFIIRHFTPTPKSTAP